MPGTMMPTDEACGYESSAATDQLTYTADVELVQIKKKTEANERPSPGVPLLSRSQVSAHVPHRGTF